MNASRGFYPLKESETPLSADNDEESQPGMEERPNVRTLRDFGTPSEETVAEFEDMLHERVQQGPFESRPRLPRTQR